MEELLELEDKKKRNPTSIHEGNKSITDYKQSNEINRNCFPLLLEIPGHNVAASFGFGKEFG